MLLFVLSIFIAVVAATSPTKTVTIPTETSPSCYPFGLNCLKRCAPTCKVPIPKDCRYIKTKCDYCGTGKVWNEDKGRCVLITDCPYDQGCNGDPNASIRENPPPCPSTCETPDEVLCKKSGVRVGCVCNPGYILSAIGGKCIQPDTCPGGNPCGVNGTFVSCKIDCPSDYCPVDDSRGTVICDPGYTCPSGCICKYLYNRKSIEDRTCILAHECPEVPCTRPNEAWDSCPSACFSDDCSNYNIKPRICYTFVQPKCYPQCTCKEGYARYNETCICGEDCPVTPTDTPQPVEPQPVEPQPVEPQPVE